MSKLRSAVELEQLRDRILNQRDPNHSYVVTAVGTCGLARGAADVAQAVLKTLGHLGLTDSIAVRTTGCHGFCEIEPVVVIYPERILYQQVTPADIPEIISESVINNKAIERLLYRDPSTGENIVHGPCHLHLPLWRDSCLLGKEVLDGEGYTCKNLRAKK